MKKKWWLKKRQQKPGLKDFFHKKIYIPYTCKKVN